MEAIPSLIEWLAGDECHARDEAALAAGLGERLCAAGLAVDWLSLHLRTLHPELLGRMYAWTANASVPTRIREVTFDHARSLVGNPVRCVMETQSWLQVRTDRRAAGAWPQWLALQRAGIAEVIVAPLLMRGAPVSAVVFGTRRDDGFSAIARCALARLVPALRGACEVRVLREVEATLLDTYVGSAAGREILAGDIGRGRVRMVQAALLQCDLRGFTALSNRLPGARVLALLNRYFDQVVPAIAEAGGEVLKFMGDAVLAFFRHDGGPRRSCSAALAAARTGLARLAAIREPDVDLDAGIALHHGDFACGNIGSGRRLDFTLIGRGVNLTSRIASVCAATGHSLLMSRRFVRLLDLAGAISTGRHALKGFSEPVELFALHGSSRTTTG